MHHTTLTYLQARRTYAETDTRRPDEIGRNGTLLETAFRAWRSAGYPDADPEPEAARAPSLDDLARAVAPLEVSPLAGGSDLRAELEAARADHLADVNARAAENDDLRAKLQAMHRRAQGAEAEATRLGRWTIELRETNRRLRGDLSDARADADHWRGVAEDIAARPRLRDRVWRWVGVDRG